MSVDSVKIITIPHRQWNYVESTVRLVTFQVLTAASMKVNAFWDVAPYSLVQFYQHFLGALMMEAVRFSETSVNLY
jgi:hypothetical protein